MAQVLDMIQHSERIKHGLVSRMVSVCHSSCSRGNFATSKIAQSLIRSVGDFQFIDEGREVKSFYATDDYETDSSKSVPQRPASSSESKPKQQQQSSPPPPPLQPPLQTLPGLLHSPTIVQKSPSILSAPEFPLVSPKLPGTTNNLVPLHNHKRRRTNEGYSPNYSLHRDSVSSSAYDPVKSFVVYESPTTSTSYVDNGFVYSAQITSAPKIVEAEYRRLADSEAAWVPSDNLLSPAIWKEQFVWPNIYTTNQCACLMRYFIEHLAAWVCDLFLNKNLTDQAQFDAGNPMRHFELLVPQLARRCPPLLNAIFTAASKHLASIEKYKDKKGKIIYEGIELPRLNSNTSLNYHNACIAYLRKLSGDREQVQDESFLAAAVILRYFEELDVPFTDDGPDTCVPAFQMFIHAQAAIYLGPPAINAFPHSTDLINQSSLQYPHGLQHACFRTALRQEITRGIIKQCPVRLPISRWSILEGFTEADDIVWADRHILHCAKVLQFCFGEENIPGITRAEQWNELKQFEAQWERHKPLQFSAIHYQAPNKAKDEVFPQIWYTAEAHVSGMQHFNLARILLTVYNPTIPRLGPGATAAQRRTAEDVRAIVILICGTALSNMKHQPAMVQAYLAIAICGEHFTDRAEQHAILSILARLEKDYAFPTSATASDLKSEWGIGP